MDRLVVAAGPTPAERRGTAGRRRKGMLYLAGLALLIFAVLTLTTIIVRTPARSGAVDLAGAQLLVTLRMAPDPPKTGSLPIEVLISDGKNRAVSVDAVTVRYGAAQQAPAEVAAQGVSVGVYRTEIRFTNVGRAWVEVALRRGSAQGQVRFTADVRPNI